MKPLILTYDVEGLVVEVLKARHPEHLAKLERDRELQPRTFEQFKTVVRMSDAAATRLSGDTVPALLLGIIGAPSFVRNEEDSIDAVFQLGMQITVLGTRRRDVIYRRDVYTWTTVECMYQRLPRDSVIHSVRLVDYEPLAPDEDKQRVLGDARLVFEVGVNDVLSITGGLPAHNSPWPVEAGGAPVEPYDPVEPRPNIESLTFDLSRLPLSEDT